MSPSLPASALDPRMVRTADALLSVAEALLEQPWPPPGGDITGFLQSARLSLTAVESDGGRISTPDGLVGQCQVTGSQLDSVTFLFDRLRPSQLQLAAVISDWFTARFGRPQDTGEPLPRQLQWSSGPARVVLEWVMDPEPRVTLQICRNEQVAELGATGRALLTAIRVFSTTPRPESPAEVGAWFARAGVRPIESEPGHGLVTPTARRLSGHWTGEGVPDEVYLTAHGEPEWLDQVALRVRNELMRYLDVPDDESQDPTDGTLMAEWTTEFAECGVLRSPARGIAGIFVSRPDAAGE